jgi:hypothetical protein
MVVHRRDIQTNFPTVVDKDVGLLRAFIAIRLVFNLDIAGCGHPEVVLGAHPGFGHGRGGRGQEGYGNDC